MLWIAEIIRGIMDIVKDIVGRGNKKRLETMAKEIAHLKAMPIPTRYIEITRYEQDANYIRVMAGIAEKEEFRFFLYDQQEEIVKLLEATKPTESQFRDQLVGELKMLNIIRAKMTEFILQGAK